MNHQWTTISESVKKAREDTRQLVSPSRDDTRKNKRIAVALASTGVFLILVGAAPFVFNSGENASDYAAYLGQDPDAIIANAVPSGDEPIGIVAPAESPTPTEFGSEPIDIPVTQESPVPTDNVPVDLIPVDIPITQEPTATPPVETPTPEVPLEESTQPTVTPAGNEELKTEFVEFPVNVHVDGSAEPVDFSTVVGEEFHTAAPKQPGSGIPALPLLAFSGAAAAWMRRRKAKKSI